MAPSDTLPRKHLVPVKGGLSVPRRALSLKDLRDLPALLTAPGAFEALGVSKSTGYAWIETGVIPAVRVGGRLRVRSADLVEAFFGIDPALLFAAALGEGPASEDFAPPA